MLSDLAEETNYVAVPLVLFSSIVLFGQVDEICHRLGSEQLQGVDMLNLQW